MALKLLNAVTVLHRTHVCVRACARACVCVFEFRRLQFDGTGIRHGPWTATDHQSCFAGNSPIHDSRTDTPRCVFSANPGRVDNGFRRLC